MELIGSAMASLGGEDTTSSLQPYNALTGLFENCSPVSVHRDRDKTLNYRYAEIIPEKQRTMRNPLDAGTRGHSLILLTGTRNETWRLK